MNFSNTIYSIDSISTIIYGNMVQKTILIDIIIHDNPHILSIVLHNNYVNRYTALEIWNILWGLLGLSGTTLSFKHSVPVPGLKSFGSANYSGVNNFNSISKYMYFY